MEILIALAVVASIALLAGVLLAVISHFFGVESEAMTISLIPDFTAITTGKMIVISILCALLSILFCLLLHNTSKYMKKWIPNSYIRIFSISILIIMNKRT